jgi:hypothetical protein
MNESSDGGVRHIPESCGAELDLTGMDAVRVREAPCML